MEFWQAQCAQNIPFYYLQVKSSYERVCQRFYIASNEIGKFLDPDLILIDTQKWYVFFSFFNVIKQV